MRGHPKQFGVNEQRRGLTEREARSFRRYFIVVSALLVVAIAAGVYVWYHVQKFEFGLQEMSSMRSLEHSE